MDYSTHFDDILQAYPYQNGLPPTPDQTNSNNSDDFSKESPQRDKYEHIPNSDPFANFDQMALNRPHSPSQNHEPSLTTQDFGFLDQFYAQARRESNSDNEDMTPVQSKRKAQNRAAQRAFRERKERHVKELEATIAGMQATSASMASENARLKQDLQKVATENEILKATSLHAQRLHQQQQQLQQAHSQAQGNGAQKDKTTNAKSAEPVTTGPMRYSPAEFYTGVLQKHANKFPSHRIVMAEDTGEKLLGAGATWDAIVSHESYQKGKVDMAAVSEYLKPLAKCDGQGPVFQEKDIVEAIRLSVALSDDLL